MYKHLCNRINQTDHPQTTYCSIFQFENKLHSNPTEAYISFWCVDGSIKKANKLPFDNDNTNQEYSVTMYSVKRSFQKIPSWSDYLNETKDVMGKSHNLP